MKKQAKVIGLNTRTLSFQKPDALLKSIADKAISDAGLPPIEKATKVWDKYRNRTRPANSAHQRVLAMNFNQLLQAHNDILQKTSSLPLLVRGLIPGLVALTINSAKK